MKKKKISYSSLSGFRFMDMEILAAVFSSMQCNNGDELSIELNEITFQRHGCRCFLSSIALYKLWVEAHLLHFGKGIAILRRGDFCRARERWLKAGHKHQREDFVEL